MAIENAQGEDTDGENELDNGEAMEHMVRVLRSTNDGIDRRRLEQAVQMMEEKGQIFFYGVGSSGLAAEIAEIRLLREGKRCKAVRETHLQTIQAAVMGENDLVIGISISGSTVDLFQALKLAKDNGCRLIAITNHENSSIAKLADCVLLTHAPESPVTGGTFVTIVSQLYVLDVLFSCYTSRNWKKVHGYREKVAISINEKLEE